MLILSYQSFEHLPIFCMRSTLRGLLSISKLNEIETFRPVIDLSNWRWCTKSTICLVDILQTRYFFRRNINQDEMIECLQTDLQHFIKQYKVGEIKSVYFGGGKNSRSFLVGGLHLCLEFPFIYTLFYL